MVPPIASHRFGVSMCDSQSKSVLVHLLGKHEDMDV